MPIRGTMTLNDTIQSMKHSSTSQHKRKRKPYASTACELCRKRKVRCQNDGDGSSCERCKASGLTCHYGENRKSRGKRKRSEGPQNVQTTRAINIMSPPASVEEHAASMSTDESPQPAAMTTKHPLLRHKKRKTLKEGEFTENDGTVDIHLTNNTQLWSEDQKIRILNSSTELSTHSQLLSIRSQLQSNHKQIEDWRKDISSKQQFIDKKNMENERLISLYHKLEKREQTGTA